MTIFKIKQIGFQEMFVRVGTQQCYPVSNTTRAAVWNLEWAYDVLAHGDVTLPNGKTSHECANEIVEKYEDSLLDFLCYTNS